MSDIEVSMASDETRFEELGVLCAIEHVACEYVQRIDCQ